MRMLVPGCTLLIILAACGGGDDSSGPPKAVASVQIAGPDSVLEGQGAPYAVELRDAGGHLLTGRVVTWASLDPAVADVDTLGVLQVADTGSARLTATSEGVTDTLTVTAYTVTFAQVDAGPYQTCAVTTGGRPYCWGRFTNSAYPVPLADSHSYTQVAVGDSLVCGLTSAGQTWCWVDPAAGATQLAGMPTMASLALKYEHGCGIEPGGAAWCWGRNSNGQIGDSTFSPTPVGPSLVAGGASYAMIAPGSSHTCAVTTTGLGQCWGGNGNGQLGIDSIVTTLVPRQVMPPPATFLAIGTSLIHACGISAADSTTWCWGDGNAGQMGDNQTYFSEVPVPVHGGFKAIAVDAGIFHTCAIAPGGAAWCWGLNDRGQLGAVGVAEDSVPVPVTGGHSFATIATGSQRHNCGLTTGGVLYCWGDNSFGQLGVAGGFTATPVKVTGQP